MRAAPVHNFDQLVPVFHFLKGHSLDGSASDNQAIILIFPDVIEGLVKGKQMILGCVFGMIGLCLDQVDFNLDRRIGQAAQNLRFCYNFERHQIEQRNPQRTDVLRGGAVLSHNEYVFAFQYSARR